MVMNRKPKAERHDITVRVSATRAERAAWARAAARNNRSLAGWLRSVANARPAVARRDDVFIEALIEKTPDVLGGSARVARTRIAVWTLENYYRLGWTEESILRNYPTLRLSDLRAAQLYAARHMAEINREINENEAA